MKNIFIILLLLAFSTGVYSQSQRIKQKKEDVPPVVVKTFKNQYPVHSNAVWYDFPITFWYLDMYPVWYDDWYGDWYWDKYKMPPNFEMLKPDFFEVEFKNKNQNNCRAIYSSTGSWIETRTKIKTLPVVISQAIKNSEYKDWKLSAHKEKIDRPGDSQPIFRVKFSKDEAIHIVRFSSEGKIIQKKIKK